MAKRFQSILASELEAFLRFKQNLGQSYVRGVYTLRSFDRYVSEHHTGCGPLDWPELLRGWLSQVPVRNPKTVTSELVSMRQFCLFRRRYDPASFVPDHGWARLLGTEVYLKAGSELLFGARRRMAARFQKGQR